MGEVENLLSYGVMWKGDNLAEQEHLSLTQLEHCSSLNAAAQENLANQRPRVCVHLLLLCLQNRARNKVLLEEGLGGHVVHDRGGEVCQDAVHRVPRLLSGDPEVLLKRSRQRRKDGLGRLVAIEGR